MGKVLGGGSLRTALMDSVTHDLRTPLTCIKASVTALLTNVQMQPSERNELLLVIDEEADRLNQLIGDALEAAKRDFQVTLDLKPVPIEEIINAARADCRSFLGRRLLSVRLRPALPATRADIRMAKKALVELLQNAHKYSPPDEPITIRAELHKDFVITSISNRGGGINDAERRLIFRRFYRGRHHRGVVQGTGMGLPIAKAIIEAHGGALSVASQRDCGCVFSFTLPID
jgi:two-component system sensor histidine kinase KdpD